MNLSPKYEKRHILRNIESCHISEFVSFMFLFFFKVRVERNEKQKQSFTASEQTKFIITSPFRYKINGPQYLQLDPIQVFGE